MKTSTRAIATVAFLFLALGTAVAQNYSDNQKQLQKYVSDELYQPECKYDVSGKWVGTEIQYDETGTFIKVKFDIVFEFEQDGNKITGTSYIKDKLHEDIGYMNIRGYVIGDKLHFEEYELTGQQWETPNRVWCFRTGELDLTEASRKMQLAGDYDAYAAYDYHPCRDYCHTVVQKDKGDGAYPEITGHDLSSFDEDNLISVAPSPFREQTRLSYTLSESAKVQLDVFDLSGRKVADLVNGTQAAGKYTSVFQADGNAPGSYIVRLFVDDKLYTKQVVLMQ
ncbi:MAG: T9SS type A sorting domain-containing protein [Flavobacteriales bacterium]|nr:T9SS type A sorting domain-containing protein [Flavobacteriales bacterium]